MSFYLGLVGILAILAVALRPDTSEIGKRAYAIIAFAILGFLAATRAPSVGADTKQYYSYFTVIGNLAWGDVSTLRFEPGYFLLNKVIFLLSEDPQVFIAVTSAAILTAVGWFFSRYSPDIVLSTVLFVFLQGYAMVMTALRQSIALAIVLVFIPQLVRRRYIRFALGVVLATQFHSSALLLLVLIPMVRLGFRTRISIFYIAFAALLAFLPGPIMRLAGSWADQYEVYLTGLEQSGGKVGVLLMIFFYIFLLIVMTTASMQCEDTRAGKVSVLAFFCHASWMTIPILGLAFGSNAFLRLANYFVPFVAVGVATSLTCILNRESRRIAKYVIIVGTLAYFVAVSALRPEWYLVIPYVSILF